MKKEILLYVGGFEMPDGNAAAQRVLAIAKALPDGYNVKFLGLTHCDNYNGMLQGMNTPICHIPQQKKSGLTTRIGNWFPIDKVIINKCNFKRLAIVNTNRDLASG